MNSNSSGDRRKGAPVAPGSGSGASAGGGSGSGGASASSGGSGASMRQRHRSRSPVPTEQDEAGNGGGGGEAAAADELQSHKRARTAGPAAGAMTGGSRSAGATPARPSYFAYSPTSILASMNGSAAALPLPPVPPPVTLPYHSALSPGTAIHSPRRAMVCSSLEHAAVASSLLTQSAIHPAILHSLSVRLQAMSDAEADIVLGRLAQIASHLQHSQSQQTSRKQQQLQFLQAMSAAGAAQSQPQAHPGASAQSTAAAAASGTLPPSPMPNLSSTSSVNSSNNSNTTSPTVSPAVSAQTATAPPSPQNQLAQKPPPTPPQASLTAHLRDSASHPPLHPQPTLTPYAQMLLSSNGARTQQQQQQQQLHQQQQAQHAKDGGASAAPQPLRTSFVGATTSTSSASTTSPSGDDLPQLDSSLAPPLARSHSEDSDIPMGLMMLIEALPGATTATLAGGVGSSGVGVGGGMATPGGSAQSEQLKSPHTPHHALKANVNSSPHDALSGSLQSHTPSGFAQLQLQVAELLPPPVTRQRSTSL